MIISSAALRVAFNPEVGGTITSITHLETSLSVLGTVPWPTMNGPIDSGAARDEPEGEGLRAGAELVSGFRTGECGAVGRGKSCVYSSSPKRLDTS